MDFIIIGCAIVFFILTLLLLNLLTKPSKHNLLSNEIVDKSRCDYCGFRLSQSSPQCVHCGAINKYYSEQSEKQCKKTEIFKHEIFTKETKFFENNKGGD